MNGGAILLEVMAATIVGLNACITFLVYRSSYYEPGQKYAQYALIWLIPVIGSVLCYLFVRDASVEHSGRYSENMTMYDDGTFGNDIGESDYFGGGHHSDSTDY